MASVRPKKWRSKTAPPTTKRSSWIGEYESSKTTGCEGKDATPPHHHNEALQAGGPLGAAGRGATSHFRTNERDRRGSWRHRLPHLMDTALLTMVKLLVMKASPLRAENAAGECKAKCLKLLFEVQMQGHRIVFLDRVKPVA